MENFAKRLLMVIAALLLLGYVGYQIFLVAYTPVKVETAISWSEYETIDADGLIVRSETTVPLNTGGYVYYVTSNGSRVAKNGSIADIYADEDSATAQKAMLHLDEMIDDLTAIQEQGKNSPTSVNMLNTQMKRLQSELIAVSSSSSFSGLDDLSSQLLSILNKQQITIGRVSDFYERIALLKEKRAQLAASVKGAGTAVKSPVAGYFVNTIDGYETTLTADMVTNITVDEIQNALKETPENPNGYIGKVVSSYEWYLTCVVPVEKLSALSIGSSMRIRLPFVSSDPIPVTLVAENRDRDGNAALVFRSDYMSAELSNIRKEQVQILIKEHSGLRVPDEAVHFDENGDVGVFVQEGNLILFRHIRVIYHSETEAYSICAIMSDEEQEKKDGDKEYLRLYDDMVVEGKNLYDGKIVH
ncbi:MAG: hypothetical protein IJU16_02690 [Clostridia bacterium]|nr:hypothetical protein [Clostridia bacterium]